MLRQVIDLCARTANNCLHSILVLYAYPAGYMDVPLAVKLLIDGCILR